MKRFLSVLIVLTLLVSMFTVAAVAFAEPSDSGESESERTVTFHFDKFNKYVKSQMTDYYIEMNQDYVFGNKWWEDADKVHEIFEGIRYNVLPEVNIEGKEEEDKHGLTFVLGEEAADGEADKDAYNVTETYWETQRVKLPSAPVVKTEQQQVTPEEGGDPETKDEPVAYFNGWKVSYDGQASWRDEIVYRAGDEFAMPNADVTITALWVKTEEEVTEKVNYDKIYMLYVTLSGSTTEDMKDWSRTLVTNDISLTTEGPCSFRFAVVDGDAASESGYTFDYDDVLATTFDEAQKVIDEAETNSKTVSDEAVEEVNGTLTFMVQDTTAPQVELSTTQQNKVTDGLTVGTTYSISTSLDITDCSGTRVTYVVYKQVGAGKAGADTDGWLQIYDSNTREVAEGYEDNISTSGVITPLSTDVTDYDMYKIVYTVVDNYGNKAVKKVSSDTTSSDDNELYNPTMLLKVHAAASGPVTTTAVQAWQIVLYVIAGLSAVGIVVLLCVKPKQQTVDIRYNANEAAQTPDTDQAAPSDDQTDGDVK